jgi:hypothetical protein
MGRKSTIALVAATISVVMIYTQVTIFVVQPIGAVPHGVTIVMFRLGKLNFIDSADSFCDRELGGVSLLCRGAVLAKVGQEKVEIGRLPYSELLYSLSTGGRSYER